jgi:predicted RNA-binding Zn-ribbon protein involved in translation (DUF1610 family)
MAMIVREFTEEVYTEVCTACEEPFVAESRSKNAAWVFVKSVCVVLLSLMLFPVAILYFLFRKKQPVKCPKCGHDALIPVSSARGLEIMQKHGWKPL